MLLANRVAGASRFVGAPAPRHSLRTQNGSVTCMAASRPLWLPGEPALPTLSARPPLKGHVHPGTSHSTQITRKHSATAPLPSAPHLDQHEQRQAAWLSPQVMSLRTDMNDMLTSQAPRPRATWMAPSPATSVMCVAATAVCSRHHQRVSSGLSPAHFICCSTNAPITHGDHWCFMFPAGPAGPRSQPRAPQVRASAVCYTCCIVTLYGSCAAMARCTAYRHEGASPAGGSQRRSACIPAGQCSPSPASSHRHAATRREPSLQLERSGGDLCCIAARHAPQRRCLAGVPDDRCEGDGNGGGRTCRRSSGRTSSGTRRRRRFSCRSTSWDCSPSSCSPCTGAQPASSSKRGHSSPSMWQSLVMLSSTECRQPPRRQNAYCDESRRVNPQLARGCRRVESKRGLDLKNPNSQNQDPIFTNYKLPDHQVRSRLHSLTTRGRSALPAMCSVADAIMVCAIRSRATRAASSTPSTSPRCALPTELTIIPASMLRFALLC